MAGRVVVASTVRDLAWHVKQLLPSMKVDDAHFQQGTGFPAESLHSLRETELLLCDADALIWCINNSATPQLKWAQSTWAGVDYIMKTFNFVKPVGGFHITRTGDAFSTFMAEYVIGQIIAHERGFVNMLAKQKRKEWAPHEFGDFRPLTKLAIGILGFGSIGKEVARVCKLMGMKVWAISGTPGKSSPDVDQFRLTDGLAEVLSSCDYVCNILPSTAATQDLLSGGVLQNCQTRKTVLINIGRGNIVSDDSLVQAISEGWLGGASLDVFNTEPLPADSPLWSLPNVVITPHVSGPCQGDKVAKAFADNFRLYAAGQPLKYLLDWEAGY